MCDLDYCTAPVHLAAEGNKLRLTDPMRMIFGEVDDGGVAVNLCGHPIDYVSAEVHLHWAANPQGNGYLDTVEERALSLTPAMSMQPDRALVYAVVDRVTHSAPSYLPDPARGVYYLVPRMTASYYGAGRSDLIFPNRQHTTADGRHIPTSCASFGVCA